jgi:hypothetical protein
MAGKMPALQDVVAVAGKMPALQIAARGRIGLGEFLEDATLFSKPAETARTTIRAVGPGRDSARPVMITMLMRVFNCRRD